MQTNGVWERGRRRYVAIAAGLVAFGFYYATACRHILIGDTGELALAAATLGIAHPPGYPLFTLLGRLFIELLPFLRPVFAAGLVDITAAAGAVVAIYFILSRYLSVWSAALLSLIFALAAPVWAETTGFEVYELNLLLISLTLLAVTRNHPRKWLIAAYLFGLALTNHPSALSLLPVLIYMFAREKQFRRGRLLLACFFAILLAGSLYLYLPIRASFDPISNWGNPRLLRPFIDHITLAQYRGWIGYSVSNLVFSCRLFVITLADSWCPDGPKCGWIGVVAAITGIIAGWKSNKAITISALLLIAMNVVLSSSHHALDFWPFYLPALLGALLLIANNLLWLEMRLKYLTARLAIYAAAAAAVILLIAFNYRAADQSGYSLYEDYSKLILDTAADGVIFSAGDINSFGPLYLRYVENYRPSVEIYDRSVRSASLAEKASQLTGRRIADYRSARAILIDRRPANYFVTRNHYTYEPEWPGLADSLYSYGVLYSLQRPLNGKPALPQYPIEFDPGDVLSRQLLVNIDLARGMDALDDQPPDSAEATRSFNVALTRLAHEPRAIVLNNVGIFYRSIGQLELALQTYNEALSRPIITGGQRRDIIYNISNVYKDQGNISVSGGDFSEAVHKYTEALKYDPGNLDLLLNIGLIYARGLHDTTSALGYLNKYLAKNPSDARVDKMIKSLRPNNR